MTIDNFKKELSVPGVLPFEPTFIQHGDSVGIYSNGALRFTVTHIFITKTNLNPVSYVADKIKTKWGM